MFYVRFIKENKCICFSKLRRSCFSTSNTNVVSSTNKNNNSDHCQLMMLRCVVCNKNQSLGKLMTFSFLQHIVYTQFSFVLLQYYYYYSRWQCCCCY